MDLRRRHGVGAAVGTGPLADVSFLLVIFFVVTSVISAGRGLDFAPGESPPDDTAIRPQEAVDVHVLGDGSLEMDGRPVSRGELLQRLAVVLGRAPEKPVIVRTEGEAPYGAMVEVLDLLRRAPELVGVTVRNLAIPTRREMEGVWPRAVDVGGDSRR